MYKRRALASILALHWPALQLLQHLTAIVAHRRCRRGGETHLIRSPSTSTCPLRTATVLQLSSVAFSLHSLQRPIGGQRLNGNRAPTAFTSVSHSAY